MSITYDYVMDCIVSVWNPFNLFTMIPSGMGSSRIFVNGTCEMNIGYAWDDTKRVSVWESFLYDCRI